MSEPAILPLGPGDPQRLGSHQLIGLLGHGGMGRVYLGISPGFGQVAVKVMHPHYAGDTAFRQRFKREAETAQRVSGPFTAKAKPAGAASRCHARANAPPWAWARPTASASPSPAR